MERFALIIFAAIAFCGCKKDNGPAVPKENYIEISGNEYEIRTAEYFDGFYEIIGEECVCLHIQLLLNGENTGAGMTIEMSKEFIGEKIPVSPSDKFWFFLAGTGRESFSIENTDTPEDFGDRKGWFCIDYGESPDEIVFEWEISNPSGERTATQGYIDTIFEKINEL